MAAVMKRMPFLCEVMTPADLWLLVCVTVWLRRISQLGQVNLIALFPSHFKML